MTKPQNSLSQQEENRRRFYVLLITALALVNGIFILGNMLNRPDVSPEQRTGFDLANQAVSLYDEGDFLSAIERYTQAMQFLPDDAGLYYNRALAHLNLGNDDEALLDLRTAIDLDAGYAPPYLVLGDLLDTRNQLEDARDAYQQYIDLVGSGGDQAPRIRIRIAEIEQELGQ